MSPIVCHFVTGDRKSVEKIRPLDKHRALQTDLVVHLVGAVKDVAGNSQRPRQVLGRLRLARPCRVRGCACNEVI